MIEHLDQHRRVTRLLQPRRRWGRPALDLDARFRIDVRHPEHERIERRLHPRRIAGCDGLVQGRTSFLRQGSAEEIERLSDALRVRREWLAVDFSGRQGRHFGGACDEDAKRAEQKWEDRFHARLPF
ncbi:MAG TPA: hypothetical protein VGH75_06980 [Steroidobacteraceae bacterium]